MKPEVAGGWPLVGAAAVCVAVGSFDLSGVNVVLPRMAEVFGVDAALIQWVAIGYLLPIAALALPVGRWLDSVGKRSALLVLLAGFAGSSAAAGAAPTLALLIAARVVQGAFGSGLFAIAPVIAFHAVPRADRPKAVAAVSAIGAAGGVAGPSLGALLAQAFGWQWIFWIALPALVAVVPVVIRRVPRGAGLAAPAAPLVREAALIGAGICLVLLSLTFTAQGSAIWLLLAVGAVPVLVAWYRLHDDSPAVRLARLPGFASAVGTLSLLAAAVLSSQYLLAFLAERTLHVPPGETGAALLALPASTLLFSMLSVRFAARFSGHWTAVAGFVLMAVAIILGTTVHAIATLIVCAALIGAGQGLANTPSTHFSMGLASSENSGSTGAAISLFRNIGFTVGPAVVSAVWGGSGYSGIGMGMGLAVSAMFAFAGAPLILLAVARQRPSSAGLSS